jgi:hypothetical protein
MNDRIALNNQNILRRKLYYISSHNNGVLGFWGFGVWVLGAGYRRWEGVPGLVYREGVPGVVCRARNG